MTTVNLDTPRSDNENPQITVVCRLDATACKKW